MFADLRDLFRRFASKSLGERGVAAIEAALAIPVLAILLIGVAEIGDQILVRHQLNTTAARIGDLVTRSEKLSQAELNDIFDAVEHINGAPLGDTGVVIITAVTGGPEGAPTISWQESGAGTLDTTSSVGSGAGGGADLPQNFTLAPGETVIVVEVIRAHGGVISEMMEQPVISKTTYHRGRVTDLKSIS